MWKKMTVVVDGFTFEKVIGESNIYCEQYGVYIPYSDSANSFDELIDVASKWINGRNKMDYIMDKEREAREVFDEEGFDEALFLILAWRSKNEVSREEASQLIKNVFNP